MTMITADRPYPSIDIRPLFIHDAPGNGEPLAAFIGTTSRQIAERAARAADLDTPFGSEDARRLRTLIESFIDARRVWEEQARP
jgi:hypothetical protein